MKNAPNVYHRFIEEVNALGNYVYLQRDAVGELSKAVRRAQMVVNGELPPVSARSRGTQREGGFQPTQDPPSRPPAHAIRVEPHPATAAVLRYFAHDHLPERLAEISRPFSDLAQLASSLDGPEVTVALRKLLEAKDCAVRAAL